MTADPLPAHAALIANKGPATADAVKLLVDAIASKLISEDSRLSELFSQIGPVIESWDDDQTAILLAGLATALDNERVPDIDLLVRWIRAHPNEPEKILDCLAVSPPEGITVLSLLSQAGSQKVVYLANWDIALNEIVLKRFIGVDAEGTLLERESRAHPLSLAHPNIIDTHVLSNDQAEHFLVEKRLSDILSDGWESHGVSEAANILRDIASALTYLHSLGLVHGDVKPDNIGYEERSYLLLDFGICRPETAFGDDDSATGSLRTRAPELLAGHGRNSKSSDVWAIAATVFNTMVGHFPLIKADEYVPRVSSPEERTAFEDVLRDRVENEWDERVGRALRDSIEHSEMRAILEDALARDPEKRISADDLVKRCDESLGAFVRGANRRGRFSASDQVTQLERFLPEDGMLALMPQREKTELERILKELQSSQDLNDEQSAFVDGLANRLATLH